MKRGICTPETTVVLTTHERAELYRTALGDGIDMRFGAHGARELHDALRNCANSGARLVVLDEVHFVTALDMAEGLRSYVDDADIACPQPEIIVVCPEREPPDELLTFLVKQCGIYGIVYGCDEAELVAAIAQRASRPSTRRDVLDIAAARERKRTGTREAPQQAARESAGAEPDVCTAQPACSIAVHQYDGNACDIKISIKIEIAHQA